MFKFHRVHLRLYIYIYIYAQHLNGAAHLIIYFLLIILQLGNLLIHMRLLCTERGIFVSS